MPKKKRKVRRTRSKNTNIILIQRKFFVYSILVIILGIFLLKIPIISQTVDVLGISSFFAKGGDDDRDGRSGSGSSSSGSSRSESSNSTTTNVSSDDEDEKDEDEEERKTIVETQSDETRTEIRLSEAERIRVRTKDGRTRIDITSGGIKTRLEFRDDRVVIKAEQEDGTEVELEDDTLLKIEERLGASGIKIATAGAEKFVVQRGGAGAVTEFPLSVDLATNTLIVNTPAGQRQVTVLPDQAVQNLIAANVISQLVSNDSLVPSDITSVGSVIALGEKNGVPIYQILGISNQRLLGFIPVVVQRTVTVSAQTGVVESTQTPILDQVLDLVSF